ncbi:MAG: nucleotidyl transferase AbiEii/AbiGii toxin family protein [Candidatus Obscuribacterales bacterium]
MNELLLNFYRQLPHKTQAEAKRTLRQILQQVALLGLWRTKFFEHAGFYGETALRLLYGLNRFSGDLDFTLLKPNPSFSLQSYLEGVSQELLSFGVPISAHIKPKSHESAIQSAFLKANTLELLLQTEIPELELKGIHLGEQLKIRVEIDTDPPPHFRTEEAYLLQPLPFSVYTLSKPDLFAGKLHALLCREWEGRVKGRDWWDFLWFIGQDIPVHLAHLEARMRQTGHYPERGSLTIAEVRERVERRATDLNVEAAKRDLSPFIPDPALLSVWTPALFKSMAHRIKAG